MATCTELTTIPQEDLNKTYTIMGTEYTLYEILKFPLMCLTDTLDKTEIIILYQTRTTALQRSLTLAYGRKVTDQSEKLYIAYVSAVYLVTSKFIDFPLNILQYGLIAPVKLVSTSTKKLFPYKDFIFFRNIVYKERFVYKTPRYFNVNLYLAFLYGIEDLQPAITSYISKGGDSQLHFDEDYFKFTASNAMIDALKAERPDFSNEQLAQLAKAKHCTSRLMTDFSAVTAAHRAPREYSIVIGSLLLIGSVKTFENHEHAKEFIKRRTLALSVHCSFQDVKPEKILDYIDIQSLIDLNRHLTFYPILKGELFATVLDSPAPWAIYCKQMLEYSQLKTFKFIASLLLNSKPTKILFEPMVAIERKEFIAAYKRAEARYGERIKYAKLINPQDTSLDTKNWPLLASISIYHAYMISEDDSLLRFRPMALPLPLLEMLAIEVKDIYLNRRFQMEDTFTAAKKTSLKDDLA